MILQDLKKAAHVGTLKLVRQIHSEGDGGHGVLGGTGTVAIGYVQLKTRLKEDAVMGLS